MRVFTPGSAQDLMAARPGSESRLRESEENVSPRGHDTTRAPLGLRVERRAGRAYLTARDVQIAPGLSLELIRLATLGDVSAAGAELGLERTHLVELRLALSEAGAQRAGGNPYSYCATRISSHRPFRTFSKRESCAKSARHR